MIDTNYLDSFEQILFDGLKKLIISTEIVKDCQILPSSPDIDEMWENNYIKEYIADAVENFNESPEASIAWAGFLGMAVAHYWETDWELHKEDSYQSFYGSRGFDDMDENILFNILKVEEKPLSDIMLSCATATLALIKREEVELQTETGFYLLARCYTVLYKIGAAIQLSRAGYSMHSTANNND